MKLYKKPFNKNIIKSFANQIIADIKYRAIIFAFIALLINIAYAFYNCFLGIRTFSLWFITMGFYYMLLGFMRFHVILCSKKIKVHTEQDRLQKEYSLMKHNGAILLLLTLALSGTVVLTIKQNHIKPYGTIVMITIAAYTFYKITIAVINLLRVRKQNSPLLSTIRNINIADAAMSVLPMQTSMIASFDNGSGLNLHLFTILTGSGIGVIFIWLGLSMIIISRRETHGKI